MPPTSPSAASMGLMLALVAGQPLPEAIRGLKNAGLPTLELYEAVADHEGHERALCLVAQFATWEDASPLLSKGMEAGANPWVVYGRVGSPNFRTMMKSVFSVDPETADALETLFDLGGRHLDEQKAMVEAARTLFKHDTPRIDGMVASLWREAARIPFPAAAAVLAMGYYKRLRPLLGTLLEEVPNPMLVAPLVRAMARMCFPPELAENLSRNADPQIRGKLSAALESYRESHGEAVTPFLAALGPA